MRKIFTYMSINVLLSFLLQLSLFAQTNNHLILQKEYAQELENVKQQLQQLGYCPMPLEMQANILAEIKNENTISEKIEKYSPFSSIDNNLYYLTLSKYKFPEVINVQSNNLLTINQGNDSLPFGEGWGGVFALSIDPLAEKFPSTSPYSAIGNDPVNLIDPDGMAEMPAQPNTNPYDNGSQCLVKPRQFQAVEQYDGPTMSQSPYTMAEIKAMQANDARRAAAYTELLGNPMGLLIGALQYSFHGSIDPERAVAAGNALMGVSAMAAGTYSGSSFIPRNSESDRLISLLPIDPTVARRVYSANQFYSQFEEFQSSSRRASHLSGILFLEEVDVIKLEKGTTLLMQASLDKEGRIVLGDYASFLSENPATMGINYPDGRMTVLVKLTEDVSVLQSTTAPMDGWGNRSHENYQGGSIQLFSPEIKRHSTVVGLGEPD